MARPTYLVGSLPRLAELVTHLTGCPADAAVHAVGQAAGDIEPETEDDRLAVVALALVLVRRPTR